MSQIPLFAQSSDTVLVEDARGRIVYTPDFVPAETALAWFAELRDTVPWKTQRRRMYDRDVDVPRLMAHFDLSSEEGESPGVTRRGDPGGAGDRRALQQRGASTSTGTAVTASLRTMITWTRDHRGFPIALLSLGDTRRMTIRAKHPPRRDAPCGPRAGACWR